MRVLTILTVVSAGVFAPVSAQSTTIDPSALPAQQRFDFLVGEWTYVFATGSGQATYAKAPMGTVIRESVDGQIDGTSFAGASLIYYDEGSGEWGQRWIDSFGNTLAGRIEVGAYEGTGTTSIFAVFEFEGSYFKHVWYDISEDRFQTDLLVSQDGLRYDLVRRAPYSRLNASGAS